MLACSIVSFTFGDGWSYDVMSKSSRQLAGEGRLKTYEMQKSCRTAVQLDQRAVTANRLHGGIDRSCKSRAVELP